MWVGGSGCLICITVGPPFSPQPALYLCYTETHRPYMEAGVRVHQMFHLSGNGTTLVQVPKEPSLAPQRRRQDRYIASYQELKKNQWLGCALWKYFLIRSGIRCAASWLYKLGEGILITRSPCPWAQSWGRAIEAASVSVSVSAFQP